MAWAQEARLQEEVRVPTRAAPSTSRQQEELLHRMGQQMLEEATQRVQAGTEDQKLLHTIKRVMETLAALSNKVKAIPIHPTRQQEISATVCKEDILRMIPVKARETSSAVIGILHSLLSVSELLTASNALSQNQMRIRRENASG